MLGKSERPKVLQLEPSRPLNGSGNGLTNGASLHVGLPPADYRVAS
jgi:hypothetical protein